MKPNKENEKKIPWSMIGSVLALLSIVIGIYFFFLQRDDQKVEFVVLIDNIENLVELKEQFGDITINYKGKDILSSNEEIQILTLQLVNEGKDIIQHFYDQDQPFGIAFGNSNIISVKIIESNSDYLKQQIKPIYFNNDSTQLLKSIFDYDYKLESSIGGILLFNKVIFERDTYLKFKVYLIQNKGINNNYINVVGKIAGIKNIPILLSSEYYKSIDKAFQGHPLDFILKMIFVFILFVLLFFMIIGIPMIIGSFVRKKLKLVSQDRIEVHYYKTDK